MLPTFTDNVVRGATETGISVGSGAHSTLDANIVCENRTNLVVDDNWAPEIDDSNEIGAD